MNRSSGPASSSDWTISTGDRVLVTGAAGFIGVHVVDSLLRRGFGNLACFVRPSSRLARLEGVLRRHSWADPEIISGNLLSPEDCRVAARDAALVVHLVTGRGKSFPACFQNSVVTTRNLLEALVHARAVRRFVNVSSFAVYSNLELGRHSVLDEDCPVEGHLSERHDAYVYAKLRQDQLVDRYRAEHGLDCVTIRPGVVFGPGKKAIPGQVGLGTFGCFLHLGGDNELPLTYVENCADAIVEAGLVRGIDGRVYNVVDDELPSSRVFLRRYKQEVGRFGSIWIPYPCSYLLCAAWERYSRWSEGQLPPVFNRRFCSFFWKGHRHSNTRLKTEVGWRPRIPMPTALQRYFEFQRSEG